VTSTQHSEVLDHRSQAELSGKTPLSPSSSVVKAAIAGLIVVAVVFAAAISFGGSTAITGSASANSAAVTEYTVPDLRAAALVYFDSAVVHGDADSISLTITEYASTGTWESLVSYLGDLGFSSATYDRMMRTRALDGTLAADGHNCNVTWTYHPDDGLQMIFETTPAK
jgi:hypothetical protein